MRGSRAHDRSEQALAVEVERPVERPPYGPRHCLGQAHRACFGADTLLQAYHDLKHKRYDRHDGIGAPNDRHHVLRHDLGALSLRMSSIWFFQRSVQDERLLPPLAHILPALASIS